MNLFEFITCGGLVKTAAGHIVTLTDVNPNEKFGIKGMVNWVGGHKSEMEWDVEGFPEDRRTHHGLNLLPVVSVTKYQSIPMSSLKNYDSFSDLREKELRKIKDPGGR